MADQSAATHSTFVIERTFAKPPEKVFAAFADPAKKRRWFAEGPSHEIERFDMDFRLGGTERLTVRLGPSTPFAGVIIDYHNWFLDIIVDRRVVISQAMDFGGKRVSASVVTVELRPETKGTVMICTHQGAYFEGSGGSEMREHGWRVLFDRLAKEVDG